MELVMYLSDERIASLPIDREFISRPGYIQASKQTLLAATKDLPNPTGLEPDFFLLDVSFPQANVAAAFE